MAGKAPKKMKQEKRKNFVGMADVILMRVVPATMVVVAIIFTLIFININIPPFILVLYNIYYSTKIGCCKIC